MASEGEHTRYRHRRRQLVVALGLVMISGHAAWADQYHYNSLLIGDRAAGMGGAYTAVADSPAGLYYNPAGTVYAQGRNISASMNTYQAASTHYKDVLAGQGWDRESSSLLPNFFGILQPLGEGTVGLSYAVPDSMLEDQDQIFHDLPADVDNDPNTTEQATRYVINFNHSEETYNFGPSYALPLAGDISVGATLYAYHRQQETILNQLVEIDTNDDGSADTFEWSNNYFESTETGVRPVLGVMWSASDRLALGLSVSQTHVLEADSRSQQSFKGTDASYDGSNVDFSLTEGDSALDHPLAIRLGVAYFPNSQLLISGDLAYHGAKDDRQAIWNAAAGMEYYFTSRWAVRAGLFSDRANTPELTQGQTNQAPHVDLYGTSLSISRFTRNASITLGGSIKHGTGEAQIISGNGDVQDTEATAFALFLSAAYTY